jgi:hypothetical protein
MIPLIEMALFSGQPTTKRTIKIWCLLSGLFWIIPVVMVALFVGCSGVGENIADRFARWLDAVDEYVCETLLGGSE